MEKEQYSNLQSKKNDKDFFPLYEILITNDSSRKNDKAKIVIKLDQIKQMIRQFKQETNILKPSQKVIETLKYLMEQIDTNISDFKQNNLLEFENCVDEEKLLTKEIEIYEKKIQNWSSSNNNQDGSFNNSNVKVNSNDKYNSESSDLLKEVIDFDRFLLANGGHNGGWEEIDHSLFLKIRNKHKGKQGFIEELEGLIATKNKEQIEAHEDWYTKYLNLNELKKQAIKKWKEDKKMSKTETVNLVDEEIKLNKEIERELKNRIEKRKQLEKQEINKKLNEWRLEREIDKAKELERERTEEQRRIESDLKEQMRKAELRQKVMEYKKEKEELNEYIQMEQFLYKEVEKEMKSKIIKEEIKNFQQRDFSHIEEKKAKLKAKEEEKEERKKRLEKQKEKIEIEHDPSRLYQMTSTWKNRVNTPRSDSCGPVLSARIPHLAVPSWRQGI